MASAKSATLCHPAVASGTSSTAGFILTVAPNVKAVGSSVKAVVKNIKTVASGTSATANLMLEAGSFIVTEAPGIKAGEGLFKLEGLPGSGSFGCLSDQGFVKTGG